MLREATITGEGEGVASRVLLAELLAMLCRTGFQRPMTKVSSIIVSVLIKTTCNGVIWKIEMTNPFIHNSKVSAGFLFFLKVLCAYS